MNYSHDKKVFPSKGWRRSSRWTCCQVTFLTLGVLWVMFAVAMLAGGYQALFNYILHSQLEIQPGSRAYDIWRLTPVPLFLRFYFFNITNPEDFEQGAKPILDEVGPYTYREYHEKQNLTFNDNQTVTYYQQRWWVWDQESSGNLSQDDIIVSLNTVPVSAAWSVHGDPTLLSGLNLVFKILQEQLTVEATVGDTLFNGYTDPLLDWMQEHVVVNGSINPILPDYIDFPPGLIDYDKFGWFYKRNLSLTYDGLYNMRTGQDTLDNLGQIDLWNREHNTSFFDYPCNEVTGSAGELWPPGLQKDFVEFFSSDLCMSVKLFYKEETTDPNGLPGYRYWGTSHTFANGSVVPGNDCYCVKNTCAPTGLLNAESCRMGAPAFISFPHFFNADPFLLDGVEGLDPADPDKHAFFMDLIPEVGTPMQVAARMQINMHVIPYKGNPVFQIGKIDILSKVSEVYLPLLWFEETAGMPEDLAEQLKALLFIINTPTVTIILSIILVLGLLTILLVFYAHWRSSRS